MLKSAVQIKNGIPYLTVEGQPTTAMAYATYFEERSRYEDFIKAGYRIFFVNVSFTTAPINPVTEFTPFRIGVFEDPEHPNYSEFEDAVRKILHACPDAVIFPRIYISMPKYWIDAHPNDVVPTKRGALREVMFSETFKKDGAELLLQLVRHIKDSDYAPRVGGWMLCGSSTQEWFFRDSNGDLGPSAQAIYRSYVKEHFGIDGAVCPDESEYLYAGNPCIESENAKRYAVFCNLAMAQTLDFFAHTLKKEINFEQTVGAFYGYTFEGSSPLFGSFALRTLLDSPNLDFFSSPSVYTLNRAFGMDWADQIPTDSVKHHGKLCFIECDIRTHLTQSIQKSRPGEYPDDIYSVNGASVWVGPPTAELSREALRKSFAHQITKASAMWWFDMWGGWYRDPLLMQEMAELKKVYDADFSRDKSDIPSAEVVFFADEQSGTGMMRYYPHIKAPRQSRTAMGKTGVPFDTCMVEDADCILKRYKAAVFPFPFPSEAGKHAMELCRKMGIPYLATDEEHVELTVDDCCEFYQQNGIRPYAEKNDVVYVGNGYVGLHSAVAGMKQLKLPKQYPVTAIFGTDFPTQMTDTVNFYLKENATALFSVCP